jgi:multidrug efflux pump subunit AcrA (membrane-fusion protein)
VETIVKKLIVLMSVLLIVGCSPKPDAFNTKYSGILELTEHVLGARVAGRLSTMTVNEGDQVRVHQVLGTLDRYQQAKKDYERTMDLFSKGGATAQAVEYAKLVMEDQQIMSLTKGVVLVKAAEIGETLQAGAGVVVVGDSSDQWIKVYLPEGLIGQLKLKQQADVTFDGMKKAYQGHISFIATKAEFTPRNVQTEEERVTQVFAVKVALDHPDEHIHPGVAADVQFKN